MDNIFGVGLPEVALIIIIAGMVMGPERIARAARTLGALVARIQKVGFASIRQLTTELDSADETGQLRVTVEEMNELHHQMAELRKEILSLTTGSVIDGKQAINEARGEIEHSIMPPPSPTKARITRPTPARKQSSIPQDDDPAHQPPRLFPTSPVAGAREVNGNGLSSISPPPRLPARTNILEDPD